MTQTGWNAKGLHTYFCVHKTLRRVQETHALGCVGQNVTQYRYTAEKKAARYNGQISGNNLQDEEGAVSQIVCLEQQDPSMLAESD